MSPCLNGHRKAEAGELYSIMGIRLPHNTDAKKKQREPAASFYCIITAEAEKMNATGWVNPKRNITKRLLVSEYVAYDTETTGIGRSAEIIDIGAVRIVNGEIKDVFETLVKPSEPVDERLYDDRGYPTAFSVHHITNAMLENAPCITEALIKLRAFIGELPVLEHSSPFAPFDTRLFTKAFSQKLGIEYQNCYVNTCELAYAVIPKPAEVHSHSLETLSRHFGIRSKECHRALPDAIDAYKLYEILKRRMEDRGITLEELREKSACRKTEENGATDF